MRSIKFRAWVNILIDPFMTYQVDDIDFQDKRVFCDNSLMFDMPEDAILMQFTGLFDKNGKEIYEGDIGKVLKKNYEYKKPDYPISTIVFEDASFWIKPSKENWTWLVMRNRQVEIIGNIYENPELLKETPNE